MKYSIVIPTNDLYHVYLLRTLESLNNQPGYSDNDYEVIVVNDGSTEDLMSCIGGINRNYYLKYIYVLRDEKSSRARARNRGWQAASGIIIVFLDSDIIVNHDYLRELDRSFSIKQDIIVIGNRLLLSKDISIESVKNGSIFDLFPFDHENFDRLEFRHFFYELSSYNANAIMCPWTMVYSLNLAVPKVWVEKIHGFDESFKSWGMEDLELGYSLYNQGLQIVINSKLEVWHQYHGERNDLVIPAEKKHDYEENIDHFMNKHPQALKMRRHVAYSFLKGYAFRNSLMLKIPRKTKEFHFMDHSEYFQIKAELTEYSRSGNELPIVYDYVEDTDFDIWIQCLGVTNNTIRYYPMSRRLNSEKMLDFLKINMRTDEC